MNKLIEGQISFSGVREALEAVRHMRSVKNGVLRITSNESSGMIGVFCGRFITGAVLTLSCQIGRTALIKLLSSKEGTFAFYDAGEEHIPDVMQSLGIDLEKMLAGNEFNDDSLLTEETLTGLTGSPEAIKAIDTTFEVAPDETEADRISRVTRTYEKLLLLSQEAQGGYPPPPAAPAVEVLQIARESLTPVDHRAIAKPTHENEVERELEQGHEPGRQKPIVDDAIPPPVKVAQFPPWDIPYTPPQKPEDPSTTFSRLKRWSDQRPMVQLLTSLSLLLVILLAIYFLWPKLLTVLKAHH